MSVLMQLVSTIGLVLAIAYSIYRWKRRNLYAFAAKFTGPKEYPFIGSALMFLRNSPEEYFNVLNNVCQPTKTGEFKKVWFGPQLGLVISEPEDVQFFLHVSECLEKPYIYKFFGCDKGLFTAAADIWKDYRKVLNSTFNVKILRNFISIFNDKDIVLADKLKVHLGAGPFDVYKSVGKCALDNICELIATTMGLNLNLQNDSFDGNKFMGALERWLEKVTERMFNCFYHIDFIYKLTSQYKIHSEAIKDCYDMTSKVIETKRRELETDDKTDESYLADDYKKPQIYINQLFKLSKETNMFDDAAIADHIFTIIFGGHETSALTASTALVLLAIHQDVQDKVAAELREVFYTDEEYPDMDILGKLTYMDMVVKEVLRLFPGAPYIARLTTAEVQMPSRSLTIPKNVIIGIPIYNIHRDPKHWGPNADEFNPDNFLPENDKKRNTYTYIPFAAGPRVCLGAKYATLSIKVMLTILLRKYKFHTTLTMDTIVKKFDITMKLGHEHLVSVEPRNF